MFKNFSKIISFITVLVICISPLFVVAQGTSGQPNQGTSGQTNPGSSSPNTPNTLKIEFKPPFKGGKSIPEFLKAIFNEILLPIGGVVAALMVMYAGFLYVTAGGNTSKIENAHRALLYAVIGSAILLGAWLIQEVIDKTINQFRT